MMSIVIKKEKVVLLGDEAVGKTSLVRKFVIEEFDDKYIATIGTKVSRQRLFINGNEQVLQIWDVFGQHGYYRVQSRCLEGATGALMVMDLTRPETLWNLFKYWYPLLQMNAGKIPVILLINKSDLSPHPLFQGDKLTRLLNHGGGQTLFTSAKTGMNVDVAFNALGEAMLIDAQVKQRVVAPCARPVRPRTLIEAADRIIDDFCADFGDRVHAMSIVRQQFIIAGADIRALDRAALMRVVQLLGEVEAGFMGKGPATKRTAERMHMFMGTAGVMDIQRMR